LSYPNVSLQGNTDQEKGFNPETRVYLFVGNSVAETVTPAASELLSEVCDGRAAEFESAGEGLRFLDAVAEEFEDIRQTALGL